MPRWDGTALTMLDTPKKYAAKSFDFIKILAGLRRFWSAPDDYLMELLNRQGDIIELPEILGEPILLLSQPEHVKHVFLTRHQNYEKTGMFQPLFELGMGRGLVNANGPYWKRQRRTLQPHFQPAALTRFFTDIAALASSRVDAWQEKAARDEVLDLEAEMLYLSRQIISKSVLGVTDGPDLQRVRRTFLKAAPLIYLPDFIASHAYKQLRAVREYLDTHIRKAVDEIKHQDPERPVLAARLLEARDPRTGQTMDEEALVDELITLLFTGYETTAQALTWIWYALISNPDSEARLRQEIEYHASAPAQLDFDSIARMSYMDCLVNEALRLYPPVWATGRKAVGPDQIDGHKVRPGTRVILSQFITHRRADVWEDPLTFKPLRFADGTREFESEYSYYPFGGGPRRCLGQHLSLLEIKVILSVMVPKVSLNLVGEEPDIGRPSVTMRPAKPILVSLNTLSP